METCEIRFLFSRMRNREEAEQWIQTYLAALGQSGQIAGDTPLAAVRGGYRAFVSVPAPDALDPRHASPFVRRAAEGLVRTGLRTLSHRLIGREPDSPAACTCRQRPSLVLFTHCLTNDSPVRCGRCFHPVPLYRLPPTTAERNFQDVRCWESAYQAMDALHIGSGPGEQYAHRQMVDVRSALSKDGRAAAAALEKRTRRRVYYYLMKHYGRTFAHEQRRRCPSCGGAWLLKEPQHRIFDFRCDRCRLLSNVAFEVRVPDDREERTLHG